MSRTLLAIVPALLLAGCASTPAEMRYKDAMVPGIDGIKMSCKKPHAFTQDCSGFSGADLELSDGGLTFNIAGTADGHKVMVMTDELTPTTQLVEQVGDKVRALVEASGAKFVSAEVIGAGPRPMGYVFTYDRDVYTALRAKAPAK